jgi:hypothetical protein
MSANSVSLRVGLATYFLASAGVVKCSRDLTRGCRGLHLRTQHLGHGNSDAPLHKVAPAEAGQAQANGVFGAAMRVVLK